MLEINFLPSSFVFPRTVSGRPCVLFNQGLAGQSNLKSLLPAGLPMIESFLTTGILGLSCSRDLILRLQPLRDAGEEWNLFP